MRANTVKQNTAGHGFTLIELMVTIAVAAILAMIAVPSFSGLMEKYRAMRATETLAATLYLAKSEAIKRNMPVSLVFTHSDGGAAWCYGLTTAATCDCTAANACQLDGAESVIRSTQFKGIKLASPASGVAFSFNPVRGTTIADSAQFVSNGLGYQSRVVLSGFGRVTPCSDAGAGHLGGLKEC